MNPICKQSLPATPVASFASGLEQYQPHLQMPVDPATGSKIRVQNGGTGSSPGGISDRIAFSMKDSGRQHRAAIRAADERTGLEQ
ncbi:MAG: hypothetical protein WDO12_10280 [Pseudomonadota bacterium]